MTNAHPLAVDSSQHDGVVDEFVEQFRQFAANPRPEAFDRMFHPDATLWDAGMNSPARKSQLRRAAMRFLRNIPDFHLTVRRLFARNENVYLLTDNVGTYRGTQVSYPAVYGFRLRGGLIVEGRLFYDQARLLAPIIGGTLVYPVYEPTWDSSLVDTPARGAGSDIDPAGFVRAYDALWHADNSEIPIGLAGCYNSDGMILNPGMSRPISKPEIPGLYIRLLSAAPDLDPALQGWAGDSKSLCVEWVYRASSQGDPRNTLSLPVVDVFEFTGGGVQFGHAYLDSLTLLSTYNQQLAPRVAAARRTFFG
jgi:SnoaL-like domain